MAIRLDVMTENEYTLYVPYVISDYARRNVDAGLWVCDNPLERARADFDKLLPQGLETPDNYLCTVRDVETGLGVGNLWYALRGSGDERNAFILNMEVHDQFRGRGFGRDVMEACAISSATQGANTLGIQILGANESDRVLFRSLGMVEARVVMSWDLSEFK